MVNKVILIGNVGRDPEVRYLENDVAVASFSLATSETYTDKTGQKQTKTEWHNIVAWRNLGKLAEKYIKKGQQIFIEGKLTTRSWKDKEGNDRYTTEVIALNIQLLGKRGDYNHNNNNNNNTSENTESSENVEKKEETSVISDEAKQNDSGLTGETSDDLPF